MQQDATQRWQDQELKLQVQLHFFCVLIF